MSLQIISSLAESYAARHTTPEYPLIHTVHEETVKTHTDAHMLTGHVQGKFLTFLTNLIQPLYVLEIGTFTGYSALCIAEGLEDGGEIHTIELRQQDADVAAKNFYAAKKNNIILHVGNAKELIATLPYEWDLVYIDADKVSYIEYYELVLKKLSKKGVIIADNVLFHGQVLEEPVKGKNALAIDAFNKHVSNDPRVEQVMLTIRDGLLLIKKK